MLPCPRWTTIPLGRALRHASRDQPGRQGENAPASRTHGCPFARRRPPLFGLAPGGVYPAAPVTGGAVRFYRTVSPMPAANTLSLEGHFWQFGTGGLFSVALSLGSPPPAVSRHRISVEPGLSSNVSRLTREKRVRRNTSAAVQPSGQEAMRAPARQVNGWPANDVVDPPTAPATASSRARVPASACPVMASGRQWR